MKDQIIEKLRPVFESNKKIELAYLFGSTAKDKLTPISDIDVAILINKNVDKKSWRQLRIQLIGQIMDALLTNDVDLVILNDSPILLRYEVIKNGALLTCKSLEIKHRFFVQTTKEYCDTNRLREFHIAAAKQRALSGIRRGSSKSFTDSLERVRKLFG